MPGKVTNIGAESILEAAFNGAALPTSFKAVLLDTASVAPTVDDLDCSGYTEIASGNGYTAGGLDMPRDGVTFAVVRDPATDKVTITLKDMVWTGAGGDLPLSGAIRHMVITDDNPVFAARVPYVFFTFDGDKSVGSGQAFTLTNFQIESTEV